MGISSTMDAGFWIEALKEAILHWGKPVIFNTDQGGQFTIFSLTNTLLKEHEITISMEGKGEWMDNIFIERFWRSLKHGCIYRDYWKM